MTIRSLTALPVFNEAKHVGSVLDEVAKYADDVLVVDDGSTDDTFQRLSSRDDIVLIRHATNRGYGAALRTAFAYAIEHHYDVVVTIDCDGQHEPRRIPLFVSAVNDIDIVSGSRYLHIFRDDNAAPEDRRQINQTITSEINQELGLKLTDSFCGFKAYRVEALTRLKLTDNGYAMPIEFWVQAALHNLRIRELPVPRIYLDEDRSFGGALDDPGSRLQHYREVLSRARCAAGIKPSAGTFAASFCDAIGSTVS